MPLFSQMLRMNTMERDTPVGLGRSRSQFAIHLSAARQEPRVSVQNHMAASVTHKWFEHKIM